MEFKRILVRATNWVGDAVMCIPALQALRQQFPAAHISVLARPWVAGLYGREPFCDQLIPYNAPRGWRGSAEKWKLSGELSRRKFDCAVLFQNAFEAAALVRLAGIPNRIGYARDGRSWLLTQAIPVPKPGETPKHQRFYYLELLKRAALISDYDFDTSIRLSGSAAAAFEGRKHFSAENIQGSVIGVCPGAAYGSAKRWLPERFAEAAITIAQHRGTAVAVFGSQEEQAICAVVSAQIAASGVTCTDFSGRTSLASFIELVAACEVCLTNDSGPMHIASALGVPTVVVFGATDEHATGPTGSTNRIVREPVACSPCLLRECPIDHRCMTKVTASRVAETALRLLEHDVERSRN